MKLKFSAVVIITLLVLALATAFSPAYRTNKALAAPSGDGVAKSEGHARTATTYFLVRRDRRKCVSPLCGGYFVRRVNQRYTVCGDGRARKQCYVAEISWGAQQPVDVEMALLGGTISPKSFPRFGNLGEFYVTEAWQAVSNKTPSGTFFRVRDRGVRCITHPCPTHSASTLNKSLDRNIAGVDLLPAGANEETLNVAHTKMGDAGGIIVAGVYTPVRGPAGSSVMLRASQFYLPHGSSSGGGGGGGGSGPSDGKACIKTGCSQQICADEPMMSTCEWRPEYECYRKARCERQANGKCGFTMTPELTACLRSK